MTPINKLHGFEELAQFRKDNNIPLIEWNPTLDDLIKKGTIEVESKNISDLIKLGKPEPLTYKGKPFVVYIRDQIGRYQGNYRFHITSCQTLSKMIRDERYSRYVMSIRTDGKFPRNVTDNNDSETELVELKVCKNCLRKLNYRKYRREDEKEKEQIWNNFTIKTYFNEYGNQNKPPPPTIRTDLIDPQNVYPKDWDKIAEEQKRKANYQCQKCKRDLINDKKYLSVHHIDGRKDNNRERNLKVLCIKCHAEQPLHKHMKSLPVYIEFMEKYETPSLKFYEFRSKQNL